jgi:hypothetical protein
MNGPFENQIRNQLSDYTPEVPSYLWDQIEKKRKRRGAAFWIWISGNRKPIILVATLLVAGFILTDISKQSTGGRTIINANDSGKEPQSSNLTESTTKPSGTGFSNLKKAPALPEEKQLTSAEVSLAIAEKATNTSRLSNNTTERKTSNPIASENKKNELGRSPKNIISSTGEFHVFSNGDASELKRSRNKRTRKINTTQEQPTDGPEIITATAPLKESLSENTNFDPEIVTILKKQLTAWQPRSTGYSTAVVPCPENVAAGNKKYLEFYIGPDLVFNSFKDTANSEYLRQIRENTSNVFAYSAGARYTRVFSNSISIRGGINFSKIIEKLNSVEANIIKIIYILAPNGIDTIGNYSTRMTVYKSFYNRYNSIDIPLTLGYEFGNGNLHGNLNAGVIANIYSWQKGSTLDNMLHPISINTGGPASPYQFRTNMGIAFSGALSLYYRWDNRLQLMAEPYFRYNLSPATKEENTFRRKFQTFGLRLGMRYDLNKLTE